MNLTHEKAKKLEIIGGTPLKKRKKKKKESEWL